MLSQPDQDALEALIDRHTVAQVVEALTVICDEKADHLLSNWQDKVAARGWARTANRLRTTAAKIEV